MRLKNVYCCFLIIVWVILFLICALPGFFAFGLGLYLRINGFSSEESANILSACWDCVIDKECNEHQFLYEIFVEVENRRMINGIIN